MTPGLYLRFLLTLADKLAKVRPLGLWPKVVHNIEAAAANNTQSNPKNCISLGDEDSLFKITSLLGKSQLSLTSSSVTEMETEQLNTCKTYRDITHTN